MQKHLLSPVALLIVAFTISTAFHSVGLLSTYDRYFSDLWHTTTGGKEEAEHVGLVMVDEATLAAHRNEPLVSWGPYFGRAIQVLNAVGARVIVVDFHFGVSVEEWFSRLDLDPRLAKSWDTPFREQLGSGNVILGGTGELKADKSLEIVLPAPSYVNSLPGANSDIGFANLFPEEDGVIRTFRFSPFGKENDHPVAIGPLAALRAAGRISDSGAIEVAGMRYELDGKPHLIHWIGPEGTVPRVSFQSLLDPRAEKNPDIKRFEGRVVIIGSEHFSLQDSHLTPFGVTFPGTARRAMSGSEIQANIVETIIAGDPPSTAAPWVVWVFSMVCIGIFVAVSHERSPLLVGTLVAIFWLLASFVAWVFFLRGQMLGLGAVHLGLIIAALSEVGTSLTGERRRRNRLVAAVGKYVSPDVIDRLVASGRVPDLGGESTVITVMFLDIRNFTTLSEQLDVHEVIALLNAFLERAVEPILVNGGTVDKFLGDGLMAVFGSPVPHSDHAYRALNAAEGIVVATREFRRWLQDHITHVDATEFDIGIGLHTGAAVTGNVGSQARMEFTAIGDTVNTASRVEGLTKELGITVAVTAAVVRASGKSLNAFGPMRELAVKGRSQKVQVHELLLETG